MLKRCSIVGALVLTAAFSLDAGAQAVQAPFGPGEQAQYAVQYLGVRAGTVQITVGSLTPYSDKHVWPIVTLARTDPKLSFFPVKNRLVTYWETSAWRSIGSEFYADENRKRRRQRMQLDHEAGSVAVVRQKEGEAPVKETQQMEPGSGDIAATLFSLRSKPLAEGVSVEVPVVTGQRNFMLQASVEGRQELQTALGVREVFRLRVKTGFAGKFQSKQDLIAYVTTDDSHLLVRAEAEFLLGTLVAEIISYQPGNTLVARKPDTL